MKKDIKFKLLLIFIVVVGLFLRLWHLQKNGGLWYDEYLTYFISIKSFPFALLKSAILENCHAPLYYIFLHFWIKLLGSSDYVLRLLSAVFGVLTIPVMYLSGKELCSEKTGLVLAFITAINSFLIYYSQEMRFYSSLAFFSSVAVLYFVKITKNQTKKNFVMFTLANLAILYTHTIGFPLVALLYLTLGLFLLKEQKEQLKPLLISAGASFVLFLPYMIGGLFRHLFLGQQEFVQWWSPFNFSKLWFLVTDFFSPAITNFVSTSFNFISRINTLFFIFAIIPSAICVSGLVLAFKKGKAEKMLLISAVGFIIALTISSILGKTVFISKYAIETLPILLLLAVSGLMSLENTKLKKTLIFVFCFINLFGLICLKYSAPKIDRVEGHRQVAEILKNDNLGKKDYVVTIYYANFLFNKYYSASTTQTWAVDRNNFPGIISDKHLTMAELVQNGHELLRGYLRNGDTRYLNQNLDKNVLNKVEKGHYVAVTNFASITYISGDIIGALSENQYQKMPLIFLVFSKVKRDILFHCERFGLKLVRVDRKGAWEVYLFQKV